jgi:phenylacetate-coenzyme A ligase PaaK-like adenylate-forming protein
MTARDFYDDRDIANSEVREAALLSRLPAVLEAALAAPGWRARLGPIDPGTIMSRAALARLPVTRKADLPAMQKAAPPFAGLVPTPPGEFAHLFTSPGPIYEGETAEADPWHTARALHAAGFRRDDIVLNTFSYHLTPGGMIMDSAARALGCAVIPAGPGSTEQQLAVIEAFRPTGYAGTPDFLNILIETAAKLGRDVGSIRRALVSGAAFPPSLRARFATLGIAAFEAYAVAEFGTIAYETAARDGLVVNEDVIVEIVRPGTGDPVATGEVGEVVITNLDPRRPLIRLALGDLSMILPGSSAGGHTNIRLKGWMGRADQTTKVKGMFVRPEQMAELGRRHRELGRLRLVVTREGEADTMTLRAECFAPDPALTKLKGKVELVVPGGLPNDGKIIADERSTPAGN